MFVKALSSNSSVEGGTTLPLRFPFQQKARLFYYDKKSFHYKMNKLFVEWVRDSVLLPFTKVLYQYSDNSVPIR